MCGVFVLHVTYIWRRFGGCFLVAESILIAEVGSSASAARSASAASSAWRAPCGKAEMGIPTQTEYPEADMAEAKTAEYWENWWPFADKVEN